MKKSTIVVLGILLILSVVFGSVLLIGLIPFDELNSFYFGLPPCLGTGCHTVGGGGGMELGYVQCRGYPGYLEFEYFGLVCFPNAEKYCRYVHPFTPKEECLCEAETRIDTSLYRKFCPKNNLCYGNSFEYEFGCSEDLEKTCREREREISKTTPKEGMLLCDSAESYGVIEDSSQCSDAYIYIYTNAKEEQRRNIFNKGFIGRKSEMSTRIKDVCIVFCNNCNSTLCTKDHLCEYTNT